MEIWKKYMVYKNEVHEEHEVQEIHGVIFMYQVTIVLKVLPGKAADPSLCKAESLPFLC